MPSGFNPKNAELITDVDLNPATCNRRDYTRGLAEATLPANMAPAWKNYALALRDLYTRLGNHEAMRPNLEQTFDTPANSKNSVYFMWDFVGRTLHFLYLVPADLQCQGREKETWTDVISRSVMAASLILNERPGMLDMMLSAGPGGGGVQPKMGADVEAAARRLKSVNSS